MTLPTNPHSNLFCPDPHPNQTSLASTPWPSMLPNRLIRTGDLSSLWNLPLAAKIRSPMDWWEQGPNPHASMEGQQTRTKCPIYWDGQQWNKTQEGTILCFQPNPMDWADGDTFTFCGVGTVPGIQIFSDSKTGATTLHPHDDMLPNGLMEDMLHDPAAAGFTNKLQIRHATGMHQEKYNSCRTWENKMQKKLAGWDMAKKKRGCRWFAKWTETTRGPKTHQDLCNTN